MTGDVALDFLGALSLRDYIMRRARWIRVRAKMIPIGATLGEPFTESLLAGLYGGWALHKLLGVHMGWWWVGNLVVWLGVDLAVRKALATNVRHVGPPQGVGSFLVAWAAREVLAFPIWLYAITGSTVVWRGKTYRIVTSGESSAEEERRVHR